MKNTLSLAILLISTPTAAGEYKSAVLNMERTSITITTSKGVVQAPRTASDQEGFSDVLISPDHSLVGWLVLIGGCCQSYPLPMGLVIFKDGKVIREFAEDHPIFRWTFALQGKAVAYQDTWPHGFVSIYYKLRRIEDGKILAEFACYPDEKSGRYIIDGPVPDWVWPLAEGSGCPEHESK